MGIYGGYGGGYGGYGGGYGYGYPPITGGYGVGLAGVQTGPMTSTNLTPLESTKGDLQHVKEKKSKSFWGGVIGGLSGALVLGGLAAMALGASAGPVGLAFVFAATLAGGGLGTWGGYKLGDQIGSYEAVHDDAGDNGKIDGSTLGQPNYQGNPGSGFTGVF